MGLRPGTRPAAPLSPRLRVLDTESGAVASERALSASVPPPDGDQCGLPVLDGARVLQPTRTAIFEVDRGTLACREVLTHRLFHDVHSVAPDVDGGWLVTCTGHETVVSIDPAGHVREVWPLGEVRDDGRDYRLEAHDAFKPHSVHPNRAFVLGGRRWVTCLGTRRCVGLGHPGVIDLPEGPPHDGVVREGLLWFTTTNGHVLGLDPTSLERRVHLRLDELDPSPHMAGWCRGIEVVGDRMWVGLTQLRSSPWREVAREVMRGEAGRKRPTRVVELNWRAPRLVASWDVGNRAGGVIYGVTALAPRG